MYICLQEAENTLNAIHTQELQVIGQISDLKLDSIHTFISTGIY